MIQSDLEWLTIVANRLHKRLPRRVNRHELLSDGYIALAKLRQQYDAQRGIPFRGFALKRVQGAMIDGLRQRQRWQMRIKPNEPLNELKLSPLLEVRLGRLAKRQRLVVQLHYFEQMELRQVAATLGCTPARISQLHQRALCELRAAA